ncbi:hypothetical protein EDD86DRAFT_210330 [Gorgonomyces haynaldii]|nr:hypothetical protein EDD86DRAFT_210330 [Gorgonomyces haynaldii]
MTANDKFVCENAGKLCLRGVLFNKTQSLVHLAVHKAKPGFWIGPINKEELSQFQNHPEIGYFGSVSATCILEAVALSARFGNNVVKSPEEYLEAFRSLREHYESMSTPKMTLEWTRSAAPKKITEIVDDGEISIAGFPNVTKAVQVSPFGPKGQQWTITIHPQSWGNFHQTHVGILVTPLEFQQERHVLIQMTLLGGNGNVLTKSFSHIYHDESPQGVADFCTLSQARSALIDQALRIRFRIVTYQNLVNNTHCVCGPMLADKPMADVTLQTKDGDVSSHKLILSTVPVWKEVLEYGDLVDLKLFSKESVENMLSLIYLGEYAHVPKNPEARIEMAALLSKFNMHQFTETLYAHILEHDLSVSNVMTLIGKAYHYEDRPLFEKVVQFYWEHSRELLVMPEFKAQIKNLSHCFDEMMKLQKKE